MKKLNVERLLMPWKQRSLHGEQELDTEDVPEDIPLPPMGCSFFFFLGVAIA